MPEPLHNPDRLKIILAFFLIYVIWGSTYLAIRVGIESMPPLMMAGTRFLIAGMILYCFMRFRGAERPRLVHWLSAGFIGVLLLVVGNGVVVCAEKTVPSGLTSLILAIVPIYVALINWLRPRGTTPGARTILGLITGIAGMVLLIGPAALVGAHGPSLAAGTGILFLSSLSWAAGSVISQSLRLPKSPFLGTAMQMLVGGAVLSIISLITGEFTHFQAAALTARSLWALAYLIVFGSLVGFTAYIWLLHKVRPERVATYAYVNPVIAVFLGWALGGEAVSTGTLVSACIIVFAVWLITGAASKGEKQEASIPLQASALDELSVEVTA